MEYNKDFEDEREAGQALAKFYQSLALLQTKAIRYVAHGETQAGKLTRVQEMVALIDKTLVRVIYEEECPVPLLEPCEIPPCRRDPMTGMCMHD